MNWAFLKKTGIETSIELDMSALCSAGMEYLQLPATISPYSAARRQVRLMHERGRFVEIYVSCPLDDLVARDRKGVYGKAMRGDIPDFTGVSAPYEPPDNPEIVVHTNRETPEQSLGKIMDGCMTPDISVPQRLVSPGQFRRKPSTAQCPRRIFSAALSIGDTTIPISGFLRIFQLGFRVRRNFRPSRGACASHGADIGITIGFDRCARLNPPVFGDLQSAPIDDEIGDDIRKLQRFPS